MRHLKKLLLLLFAIVTALSCSKNDTDENGPVNENGGEIFTSQVVTVAFPYEMGDETEYKGVFAGNDIVVSKLNDKLLFFVPDGTPEGDCTLLIPDLDTTISYTVKKTVLAASPEDTIADLTGNLDSFAQTLDDTAESLAVKSTIDNFSNYFKNSSEADKTLMSIVYLANKAMIDTLILTDFSDAAGRSVSVSDVIILFRFSVAVVTMVGGAFMVLYLPELSGKVLGATLAVVAYKKTQSIYKQLIDRNLNSVGLVISAVKGENERMANGAKVTVTNNREMLLPVKIIERGVIASDAKKTESEAVKFFKNYGSYNATASKVNTVINKLNAIPFVNISNIGLLQLPAASPEKNTNVSSDHSGHLSFSLSHSGLSLVSWGIGDDGKISIKIKATGTSTKFPVETNLNYSYTDEFSSFAGKVPLTVQSDDIPIVGTWILESFNGNKPGEWEMIEDNTCNITESLYTVTSATITFNDDNTYSSISNEIIKDLNLSINYDTCTIIEDLADTQTPYILRDDNVYTLNGGNAITIVTETDGALDTTFTFIDANTLEINGYIYNRKQ